MNKISLPKRPQVAKAVTIGLTLIMAAYGSVAGYHAAVRYANEKLDQYSVSRVESKKLPITVNTVEVPILNQDQLDKLNDSMRQTVEDATKAQVDASIKSYLK